MVDKEMDLLEGLKTRRSVRHFKEAEVAKDIILKIIEAASWAPSACNMASWEVVAVIDSQRKRKLAQACINQNFVREASFVLIFCGGNPSDVAAAIQNSLLAAHYLGLEGCWVGSLNPEMVKDTLGVPENISISAVVPFGYPAQPLTEPGKRGAYEILHWEQWGKREDNIESILEQIKEDTEIALRDFNKFYPEIETQAKATEYFEPLYRWEEKYSAFVFSNLLVRWVKVSQEYLETGKPQLINRVPKKSKTFWDISDLRGQSEKAVKEYRERRGELLRLCDINHPQLIAHEREYCTKIFPKLLEEWLARL